MPGRLEHLPGHEPGKGLRCRRLHHRADDDPAVYREAVLGPRPKQQRVAVEDRQSLVEARAVASRHALSITAEVVDARDVTHQLARADRPLLRGECRDVPLNRGVEVDATPIVQQADGSRREGFRDAGEADAVDGMAPGSV